MEKVVWIVNEQFELWTGSLDCDNVVSKEKTVWRGFKNGK
mgnify:CR=1 FL=1